MRFSFSRTLSPIPPIASIIQWPPPKDSGQDQKDRRRLEDDGQKDDQPDQTRLKHERGEPEGATLLRPWFQPLLEDEIPPGIGMSRSTCHDFSCYQPSPGRLPFHLIIRVT
jgi:hypothetical protein